MKLREMLIMVLCVNIMLGAIALIPNMTKENVTGNTEVQQRIGEEQKYDVTVFDDTGENVSALAFVWNLLKSFVSIVKKFGETIYHLLYGLPIFLRQAFGGGSGGIAAINYIANGITVLLSLIYLWLGFEVIRGQKIE